MTKNDFVNIYDDLFEKGLDSKVIETHIERLRNLDKLIPSSAMFFCVNNTGHLLAETYRNRERDALILISRGYDNKEIAPRLFLSEHTANAYRKNTMAKNSCKNSIELIAKCETRTFAVKSPS